MPKTLKNTYLWLLTTLLCTLFWIDPSGFGRLPVGGDATRFGLGLMSELSRSTSDVRPPLWNSLWGFGFPALAESQLGAFYPAHLILFRLLPLEWAYAADRMAHALWAALGCWVLARSLGRSAGASCAASLTFVTSGFFLVHEPHHWAWPTTSWMPWIWWAMIRAVRRHDHPGEFPLARGAVLSLCVAMPVLTGHFQMGFVSLVAGFVFAIALTITDPPPSATGRRLSASARGIGAILASGLFAAALTAIQIIPTRELASLANDQRDWEYLSGFALPPTHTIGLILPGLGRAFSFWRPLIWDQFHTSPEELFFYVGLIPLWLAIFGILRTWKADAVTRALGATLAVSLVLASGPYLPGFSLAIQFPGFSYFRAPARWTAASTLALALLAARGLDAISLATVPPVRSLRRYFLMTACVATLFVVALESLIQASAKPSAGESMPVRMADSARRFMLPPWNDVGSWQEWVRRSEAVRPRFRPDYVKPYTNLDKQRFSTDRTAAYRTEVLPQLALMCGGIIGSFLVRGSRGRMMTLLVVLFVCDTMINRRYRSIEWTPSTGIASQSPLMKRLESLASDRPWPLAVAGDLGNLPMAVGGSPIRAYRTLDVPVMPQFDPLLADPIVSVSRKSLRLGGLGHIVIDPLVWRVLRDQWRADALVEEIDDPVLWGWLSTSEVARRGPSTFALVSLKGELGRAWRIPEAAIPELGVGQWSDITRTDRLEVLADLARPLEVERPRPETVRIQRRTDEAEFWIVSQWADPNWHAVLKNAQGSEAEVSIVPMAGGWQGVEIPGAGDWTLTMRYEPSSFRLGATISAMAWLAMAAVAIRIVIRRRRERTRQPDSV